MWIQAVISMVVLLVTPRAWAAQDWQAAIQGDGTFTLSCENATVVRAQYLFFGANWKWAGSTWRMTTSDGGRKLVQGKIADLGLDMVATVSFPRSDQLIYEYRTIARRDLQGIMGGGLEFEVRFDAGITGDERREPILLPDHRGWRWEVGRGQWVEVAFDRPIAKVHFEQGNKGRIRAMIVGQEVAPGEQRLTMTVTLPKGTRIVPSAVERYGQETLRLWHRGALADHFSPLDASFLNDDDRPAGRRGFLHAEGDRLVFEDGTRARFWGTNISAAALFDTPDAVRQHARRIAQLGYNLVRLHHHDSAWVTPNVVATGGLNPRAMAGIDWWIKCLRDEGVYLWLDLHVGRGFTREEVPDGHEEFVNRKSQGQNHAQGYAYFNEKMRERMHEFNGRYLGHVNPHTQLAYKDDPAVVGLLITNENDLTTHFGNMMADKKANPWHKAVFAGAVEEFCDRTGLSERQAWRTWEPGAGKYFLSDREHRFNAQMIGPIRAMGVKVPLATTNYWSNCSGYSLPSLADGEIVDAHSYGQAEALGVNPRFDAHYLGAIGGARLADRPLSVSEWNVFYPAMDRFTAPMWMAAVASLQGWDAPMLFVYANAPLSKPGPIQNGVTYNDPAITALAPAAAIAFRRGDIQVAKKHYCLKLTSEQVFGRRVDAGSSAAIRTLVEQSRISLALPDTPTLDWDRATAIPEDATVMTDPDGDLLAPGESFVESDTGEIRRDWSSGLLTVNTDRTLVASGWMEGREVRVGPVTFGLDNPKATAVFTSLDGEPIGRSRHLLLTLVARATLAPEDKMTFYSEPVSGRITLRSDVPDLTLHAVAQRGGTIPLGRPPLEGGEYRIRFPAEQGTHWFILKATSKEP